MDLLLQLENTSRRPLYKQLVDQLILCIRCGRLREGDLLPPSRELARTLGLSRHTVVRAYDELISRKYFEVKSTNGTFVRHCGELLCDAEEEQGFFPAAPVVPISDYSKRLIDRDVWHPTSSSFPLLHFGGTPPELLPTKRWQQVLLECCEQSPKLVLDVDVFGCPELRKAIARYLRRTKGMNCSYEQVVVFSQTQNAVNLLCRLLLCDGDKIAVEEPGFGGIRNAVVPQSIDLCPVEVDKDGMKIRGGLDHKQSIKLVYCTPAHHDPTGATLSVERRQELLAYCHSQNAWIIEDDFDSDFYYGSKPLPPLASRDSKGIVIYLSSFWKALFPLTVTGFVVLPPSLVQLMKNAKSIAEPNSAILEHRALADFIEKGYLEHHLHKLRKMYTKQRSALLFNLKQTFKDSVTIADQSAGSHQVIWFNLPSLHRNAEKIESTARDAGLRLQSTASFYCGIPRVAEFLLDFSSVGVERAAEQVAAFHAALFKDEETPTNVPLLPACDLGSYSLQ